MRVQRRAGAKVSTKAHRFAYAELTDAQSGGAAGVPGLHWQTRGCPVREEPLSPGPYRSFRELSLSGLVGSDTWRPPTFVGNPGSSAPTAGAAPHLFARRKWRRPRPAIGRETAIGSVGYGRSERLEQHARNAIVLRLGRSFETHIVPGAHAAKHPCGLRGQK